MRPLRQNFVISLAFGMSIKFAVDIDLNRKNKKLHFQVQFVKTNTITIRSVAPLPRCIYLIH